MKIKPLEVSKLLLNKQSFFDIKALFERNEADPVVRRILYNAKINAKIRGSLTQTNETDKELYPIFDTLGWSKQDDLIGGDIMNSFRTLFNHAIIKSKNRKSVYAKLKTLNGFDSEKKLNDQYQLLVPAYSQFDWIDANLELFRHYASLIDTIGNIVVWERTFNMKRGKSAAIKDRFDLSLTSYQDYYFKSQPNEWADFIEKNYLNAYVDENYNVEKFSETVLPRSSDEFGNYLSWIIPKMIDRNRRILHDLL